MRRLLARSVVVAATLALVFVATPASANPGALDPSFSDDGRTSTPPIVDTDIHAEDVVVQPDGKLVVAGRADDFDAAVQYPLVARYLQDGTPDPAFGGGDGLVALQVGQSATVHAVALLSDQRIVLAGQVRFSHDDSDIAAFLLTTEGELDDSFDGDGVSVTRFGAFHDGASGIDVDAANRIVLGGATEIAGALRMAAVRLTSDGAPDPTFSLDGRTSVSFSGQAQARDVEIQANGKVVLVGRRMNPGGFAVTRLRSNGSIDTTFGSNGRRVTGSAYGANAVAIQPDGKIVAAGYGLRSSVDFKLVRYRANGSLDPTFSGDGMVLTDFDGDEDIAFDVEIQANGRIVTVGTAFVNGATRFGIARHRASGRRDLTFSGDGRASQVIGAAAGSTLYPNARLVVVGDFGGGMGTARYLLT